MTRRLLLAAGGVAPCVALMLVGAWPDPGRSLDLLTGRSVTGATEAAVVTLLCWFGAVILAVSAGRALRERRPRPTRLARVWPAAVLIIGIALLGAGIARHDGYRVCCATTTTAQEAEQLVH